jgi:membrane fusion protein, multidrug efflux system
MKNVLSYIIVLCLIVLIVLTLFRNKQEIESQIAFAEKKVEAYPVKVEEVKMGTLDSGLKLAGILTGAAELMLMAETQGRVAAIFKKEGEWVQKGSVIAQIDDALMQAELIVTEANYLKAEKDLERAVALSDGGAITQQQLEGLQLNEKAAKAKYIVSKKRADDAVIKAPIAGYINKLFLKEGGMIGPTVPVCELVNTRALKITVKVDEQEVVKIVPGMEVEIEAASLVGILLKGKVTSIGTKADYALQYAIEIMIDENPGEKLKAGMVATATFVFPDEQNGPVIPRGALEGSIKDPKVYVVQGNQAILKSIRISHANDQKIKVMSGLSEGELLITAGQFNLRDGMQVKILQ